MTDINIKELISREQSKLEDLEDSLESLEKKWFVSGKDRKISFLKFYIEKKRNLVEQLNSFK